MGRSVFEALMPVATTKMNSTYEIFVDDVKIQEGNKPRPTR